MVAGPHGHLRNYLVCCAVPCPQALLAAGYPLLATGTDVGLLEAAAKQNLAFVRRLKQGGACRD